MVFSRQGQKVAKAFELKIPCGAPEAELIRFWRF
jgi:hypothetical protein